MILDAFGGGAQLVGRRGDGTGAAPSPLLSGEFIFSLFAAGWGTSFGNGAGTDAGIRALAAENFSGTAHGTHWIFTTTPTTTVANAEALRVQANGGIQLNTVQAVPVAADFLSSSSSSVIVYMSKAVPGRIVFAVNNGGTIEYLYSKVDGSTATWTAQAGGTAP